MSSDSPPGSTLKFSFYASLALSILTFITWALAMRAVPPAGPYCPGDCMSYPFPDILTYYPRDYLWMYLAIFQLFAYMIFMVSQYFTVTAEKKMYSFISIAFALVSATVLLFAYYTQFCIIPVSMMNGETEGMALITQYNGHGLFIALEELGYITMSISFLFLAPLYSAKNKLEKSLCIILIAQFALNLISFVAYATIFGIDREYRFEVASISINWTVAITIGILIALALRRRLKKPE